MKTQSNVPTSFASFYATAYRSDHQHPANLALHIVGVLGGLALIGAALTVWPLWTALAYPFIHILPGLLGHRLFDRDDAVGNVRLTRKDFPLWWFLAANHVMVVQVLTLRWQR